MKLKKLTLALAIGTTLAAPAVMAQSSLQVYGKLYPYVLNETGSGATAVGTPVSTLAGTPTGTKGLGGITGLTAGNSRLGFRGQEDLGAGLKAVFQLEAQVHVDDGSGNAAGGGLMFNRNTFVGLQGRFGEVLLGNHDTIFKEYGDTLGILGLSSGTFMSSSDVLRKTGFGTSSASSFHLRRTNSIRYETPEISGFTAGLQYSTDEANTDTPPRSPKVISMGVKWDNGPFYVALAHEIHHDLYGGSRNAPSALRNNGATDPTRSRDKATQLTVEWRATKQHKFEFDAIRKEYKENAAVANRFSSYRNMAYMLAMENRWTNQFRTAAHLVVARAGSCTRVAAACNTDGLEGKKLTVGAAYYLSKRTYLFTAVSKLVNGKSARFSNTDFDQNPNPGEDIKQFAVGISHSF
jgi:Outer membrane protein (porin)